LLASLCTTMDFLDLVIKQLVFNDQNTKRIDTKHSSG